MKLAVCAAGTGGHIYPGIAAAAAVKSEDPGARVLFFCSGRRIEKEIFSKEGYDAIAVPSSGLPVLSLISAFIKALKVLSRYRPDVLLSMGGYSSIPVILAAKALSIPVVLHEQNVLPGKANRLAARFAQKVAVSFEETKPYLSRPGAVVTGNPVRKEVLQADRRLSREKMRIAGDSFAVLVIGGSQGARSINNAAVSMAGFLEGCSATVIHVSGPAGHEETKKLLAGMAGKHIDYRLFPYLHDISEALAASDLVISRAGATALSEIAARGLASVLVPYPHASEDHQSLNAEVFKKRGASVVLKDGSLSGAALSDIIKGLMSDRKKLSEMSEKAASLARPAASKELKRLLYETI